MTETLVRHQENIHSNGHHRRLIKATNPTMLYSPHTDTKEEIAFKKAFTAAVGIRPSPVPREPAPKLRETQVDLIADTAESLGKVYTNKLLGFSDKQEAVFTNTFVREYDGGVHFNGSTKAVKDTYQPRHSNTSPKTVLLHDVTQTSHEHSAHNDKLEKKSEPMVSKKWKKASMIVNAAAGVAELVSGVGGSALAAVGNGVHDVGDTVVFGMQSDNVINRNLTEANKKIRRKIANIILFTGSAYVAAKSGVDFFSPENTDSIMSTLASYASGTSLAASSLLAIPLVRGMRRRQREGTFNHDDQELAYHLLHNDIPMAAAAVGGVVALKLGYQDLESVAATGIALKNTLHYLPTQANAEKHKTCGQLNDHEEHDEHEDKHAHGSHIHSTHTRRATLKNRLIAGTVLTATLGGFTGGNILYDTVTENNDHIASAAQSDSTHRHQPFTIPSTLDIPITISPLRPVQVHHGMSEWQEAREAVQSIGMRPMDRDVNPVATFIAAETATPNPDTISEGQPLYVPTDPATVQIIQAVEHPEIFNNTPEDRQFREDVHTQNDTPPMTMQEKIQKKKPILERMKTYLMHKLIRN